MVIVVTDIFGYTDALQQIADGIEHEVKIVDPYQGRRMRFVNEAEAYEYFSRHVGLQAYTVMLKQVVRQADKSCLLVGFSMGASAIWCLSAESESNDIAGALGFYSSQIRYHTDIEPQFPFRLIFPVSEAHFCVTGLIETLQNKPLVKTEQCNYLHGFMNRYSAQFNQQGYDKFMQEIKLFVAG